MEKNCGNCANYDHEKKEHPDICGKCVIAYVEGVEQEPSQWKQMPQTNADRIRAKSDEELANWMYRYQVAVIKEALGVISTEAAELFEVALSANPNLDDVLNWLKQPAEGE